MPTEWSYPSIVTQYCEADAHVPWIGIDSDFKQMNLVRTKTDLLKMSNPMANDMPMKTYYLVLTGFNFKNVPTTISGIETFINIRRGGRITDETISLWCNGQALGANLATGNIDGYGNIVILNEHTYGAPTDLWGLESLDSGLIDNNFGLVLRYQTHPRYVHRSTPLMEHVQMRIW